MRNHPKNSGQHDLKDDGHQKIPNRKENSNKSIENKVTSLGFFLVLQKQIKKPIEKFKKVVNDMSSNPKDWSNYYF